MKILLSAKGIIAIAGVCEYLLPALNVASYSGSKARHWGGTAINTAESDYLCLELLCHVATITYKMIQASKQICQVLRII